MRNKVLSTIVLAAALIALILPGAALASDSPRASAAGRPPRFIDDYGLLDESQSRALANRLDEISNRHQFDTVIAVVDSLGGKPARLYAADFFERSGYGYGRNHSGIILLIAMEGRDFAFVATGYRFNAFSDARQVQLERLFLPYLVNNDFYNAFMAFADGVDDTITKAGTSTRVWTIVGSLIVALLIAFIVIGVWKAQLKSVRKQDLATSYIREGSMALRAQQDIFLHRNVTRTQRQQSSSSGSSGSFKSSSGTSFSGRSGKF